MRYSVIIVARGKGQKIEVALVRAAAAQTVVCDKSGVDAPDSLHLGCLLFGS